MREFTEADQCGVDTEADRNRKCKTEPTGLLKHQQQTGGDLKGAVTVNRASARDRAPIHGIAVADDERGCGVQLVSLGSDELLPAVDIVGRAGECGVDHEMYCKGGNVFRARHRRAFAFQRPLSPKNCEPFTFPEQLNEQS